jgi:signal transduction histidine kinase
VTISGSASGGEVLIAVSDTGIGIPEESQQFLFDEFYRVRSNSANKTPGTGLGLHISKRIVTEMGGAICVESKPGAGSTFRVRLPAWAGQKEEAKE